MTRRRDDLVCELVSTGLTHHQLSLVAQLIASLPSRSERDDSVTERDAKRDAMDKAAGRARKYRAKHKDKSGMAGQLDADGASRFERDESVTESVTPALILSSLPLEKRTFEEVRKEEKKEIARARRKSAVPLPDDWAPNERHYAAATRLGCPASFVDWKAEDLRIWAQANDARKPDWNATFHGFLRRDADNWKAKNGKAGNVIAAADTLIARINEFNRPAPEPGIRSGTNESPVRLLSKG